MKQAEAISLAVLFSGCAAHVKVAKIPGGSTGLVSVPRDCYSAVFNGALEIRCDNGNTTRCTCTRPGTP